MRGYRRNGARLIAALYEGRFTLAELATKSGMDYERCREFLKDLKAEGVVHICDWRRDTMKRWSIAVYALGPGLDAKKPAPVRGAIRSMMSKARKEAPLGGRNSPKASVPRVASVFDLGQPSLSASSSTVGL